MSEEPDYMSDEFLHSCISCYPGERTRLIISRREQRERDMMKNKNQSMKKKEESVLEEGLNKPISSDNKGFRMIQKMGFQPGMGLGKQNSGITDPVTVAVKKDRKGLGIESRSLIVRKRIEMARQRMEKMTNVSEYVASVSKKQKEREMGSDLGRSRRICHQLDIQADITEPEKVWFWPVNCVKDKGEGDNEDDNEDNLELSEKLEILTNYLRKNYFYCIWCGTQYGDDRDMQDCPGPSRDLH